MAYDNLTGMTYPGLSGDALALLGTFLAVGALVLIAVYVYTAIALISIAKKTGTRYAWLAWIPIANIYLMTRIGRLEWWWMLGFLLFIIPVIGWLLVFVWQAYLYWRIAETRGFEGWWGILMALPIIGLIFLGVVAWGESERPKVAPVRRH
jgi:hypothetical protein